ncbi:MAG: NAD-dependent epimerase/dehydratase family protein [Candidatus Magasanikbacteria bacterium]
MNIYITGGTGFVGSHLVRSLDDSLNITIGSLNPDKTALELPQSVKLEKIDVTKSETLDFKNQDIVVHLVALSPLKDPVNKTHKEVHFEGTKNVLKTAINDKVDKIVHLSALGADPKGETRYIRAKGKAEELVKKSSMDHVIFKPSVLFGKGDEFINEIEDLSKKIPIFPLPMKGKTEFQPLYIKDLTKAISQSITEDKWNNSSYEVGGPEKLDLKEVVARVYESQNRVPRFVSIPSAFIFTFLTLANFIPFVPYSQEQYKMLQIDNVAKNNEIFNFDIEEGNLTSLMSYLVEK